MRSPHTATKTGPCSLQLEKARVQQWRPNAAKKKLKKKITEQQSMQDTWDESENIVSLRRLNSSIEMNIYNYKEIYHLHNRGGKYSDRSEKRD